MFSIIAVLIEISFLLFLFAMGNKKKKMPFRKISTIVNICNLFLLIYICVATIDKWEAMGSINFAVIVGIALWIYVLELLLNMFAVRFVEASHVKQVESKDSFEEDDYIRICEEKCANIEKMWMDLAEYRHDLKEKFGMIMAYAEDEEYEAIISECEEAIGVAMPDSIISGNKLVDTIVSIYEKMALEAGLKFSKSISRVPVDLKINDRDATRIIGNILKNAIAHNKESGEINLLVEYSVNNGGKKLYLGCRNTLARDEDEKIETSAEGQHQGLGMGLIRETVEKYEGYLGVDEEEEGYFSLFVELYDV